MLKAIEVLEYNVPTKIQKKVIPIANKKIDIIAASKSGTGKTASYLIPMIQRINSNLNYKNRVLRGLILVPTRELVEQVSRNLSELGRFVKVKHTKIMGGISKSKQDEILSTGIDIVVATPGRLLDLSQEGIIDLSSVNFIVLDEADTMLEMGFLNEIKTVFSLSSPYRQIIMCSATISQNIRKLAKEFLNDPVTVQINDRRDKVEIIQHKAYKVDIKKKKNLAAHLINESKYEQILMFINKKDSADLALKFFEDQGIKSAIIHGSIDYKDRVQAIKNFRNKKVKLLIATDIAARGLDIKELPLVINYTLPEETDDFTHRVGRTGRAGKNGTVITLLTTLDYNHFTKIERNLKLNVKREVHENFPLTDRQPRQKIQKKKKLSEKKGKSLNPIMQASQGAKSKKTTKRDSNRNFRRK